jgi:hypothetical protein
MNTSQISFTSLEFPQMLHHDSFDLMLEAGEQYGPRLKKPSPYQLGTSSLENGVRSPYQFELSNCISSLLVCVLSC